MYGTITYNYNQIGNITYNSQVGNYTYWKQVYGTKPHAVRYAGSYSYEYDANGNMTKRNGITIGYDYDNMPQQIGSTTFKYDYSGQRVKKNSTIYIGKLYECTGTTCTKYIFAGDKRVAMKTGPNVYYYHTDHIGSSNVMTNTSGTKVEDIYYLPYGKTHSDSGTLNVKHKFTGQELDDESGLYYYGARYYDPEIGRFISPDSIVPDFSNPQSLNRYSYALNNPVIIRDADGHDPILAAALVIVSVSAAIGAINAGIQTEWNTAAMLKGAAIGAVSAAVGFGAGLAISTVVQSTVIIGMVGGAAAGATSSALSGGNVLQGMAIGAIGGAVGGGIAGLKGVDPFGKLVLGVAAGGVVSGIASELSGGTFSQGVMLTAMNAVTIFAIEQSNTDSNGVKTGEESVKKANFDLIDDESLFVGPGATEPYYLYSRGVWTEDTCFDANLGQGVKIYVKNVNILGTTITIEEQSKGQVQQQILLPHKKHVFKFTYLGYEPIPWRFCISTYSDAFTVLYEIKSTWVPGMPKEH